MHFGGRCPITPATRSRETPMSIRTTAAAFAFVTALSLVAATAAEAAKTDLRLGLVLEPNVLDPTAGAAAAIDEVVYQNVFEGLTRVDEFGSVQPALATSWEVSADSLVYTFHLATGVKYHD